MKTILSILAATALIAPGAVARPVDPGYAEREPGPVLRSVRSGAHPIARILLFPIIPFVEGQAALSPEKASCWSDVPGDVVGCDIIEVREEAQANRPTPYVD